VVDVQLLGNEGALQDPLEPLQQLEGSPHRRAVLAALCTPLVTGMIEEFKTAGKGGGVA